MASTSPTGSEPELINHCTENIADTADTSNESEAAQALQRPPALSRASTSAFEKCWICLATKDEDPPSPPNPPTAWRHPCSCSLQAHETCLLDWVADQEAPRSRGGSGRSGSTPDKILCPQCRSEIKIQRNIDPLVQLCRRVDKSYSRMVLPGLGASLLGTILSGCWAHGRLATYLVFGPEQAAELYQYARSSAYSGRVYSYALIPISLIFQRTRYRDIVSPICAAILVSTQLPDDITLTDFSKLVDWQAPIWPPLPSTAFVILPSVMQLYNWTYEKCFGELNRKWLKEVMPRREEGYDGQEGNIADILNEHEAELADQDEEGGGGMVLELEVNLGAVDEDNIDPDMPDLIDPQQAGGENRAENADGNGDNRQERGRVHQLLGDNELMDDTSSIGQLVIGSLVLPAVAAGAGELLKLALPLSWTSPFTNSYMFPGRASRPGFLATKWGRSIVGGLAFCAVKDMLVLYCRWRLAEGHRHRRIMNYDRAKKEYVTVRD